MKSFGSTKIITRPGAKSEPPPYLQQRKTSLGSLSPSVTKRRGFRESVLTSDKLELDSKAGYLKKKSNKGLWQKRYFVTNNSYLNYYRQKGVGEILAAIDLREVDSITGVPDSSDFVITIGDRTFDMRAESPGDASSWVRALQERRIVGGTQDDLRSKFDELHTEERLTAIHGKLNILFGPSTAGRHKDSKAELDDVVDAVLHAITELNDQAELCRQEESAGERPRRDVLAFYLLHFHGRVAREMQPFTQNMNSLDSGTAAEVAEILTAYEACLKKCMPRARPDDIEGRLCEVGDLHDAVVVALESAVQTLSEEFEQHIKRLLSDTERASPSFFVASDAGVYETVVGRWVLDKAAAMAEEVRGGELFSSYVPRAHELVLLRVVEMGKVYVRSVAGVVGGAGKTDIDLLCSLLNDTHEAVIKLEGLARDNDQLALAGDAAAVARGADDGEDVSPLAGLAMLRTGYASVAQRCLTQLLTVVMKDCGPFYDNELFLQPWLDSADASSSGLLATLLDYIADYRAYMLETFFQKFLRALVKSTVFSYLSTFGRVAKNAAGVLGARKLDGHSADRFTADVEALESLFADYGPPSAYKRHVQLLRDLCCFLRMEGSDCVEQLTAATLGVPVALRVRLAPRLLVAAEYCFKARADWDSKKRKDAVRLVKAAAVEAAQDTSEEKIDGSGDSNDHQELVDLYCKIFADPSTKKSGFSLF